MTRPGPTTRRGRIRIEGFEPDVDDADTDTDTGSPSTTKGRGGADSAVPTRSSHRIEHTRARSRTTDLRRRFRANRSATLGVAIVFGLTLIAIFARPLEVAAMGYRITLQPIALAPYDPAAMHVGPANAGPSLAHPFGTDWAGRDLFSRVLVGTRYSLAIGAIAVALALGIGIPVGAVAGYAGGWVDELLMRVVDALYAFPFLVLAIAVVALLGQGFWNLVLALVVTGWLSYARLLRGEILSIREVQYVRASRALGTPHRTVLARHVVPNAVAPVIVQATLNVGTVVLAAAALGFLGLGLPPGTPEWGTMLARGQTALLQGHWHVTVFPGLALFAFVLAINLVGDGLNAALDPRTDATERRGR